ncbi:MAG: hypothetical protein RL693_1533 [Verrucomicrobiota bacterium]|jgi:uncharacterized protein (TIGR03663 family)
MARKRPPLSFKSFIFLVVLALGLGGLYRFTELEKRPMHTDEAILALKTQEYWKSGFFQYDPKDYHGPFLHHATRWVGTVSGWNSEEMTEKQFRWVIAVFGMGLILLPLLLTDALGRRGAAIASLFIAVSPMMNFYSRYYIMEVPFVFLLGLFMASIWRWSRSKNLLWLLMAGLCLGLMHATKETFVINLAAMFAGWVVSRVFIGPFDAKPKVYTFKRPSTFKRFWLPLTFVLIVAGATSVWMFSNGFKDWKGVLDSIGTYESYLERAGGSGHEKPWTYYLGLLFWTKNVFTWTEALIGGLAVIGILSAFLDLRRDQNRRSFLVFLSVYVIVLLGIYSVIPYKTPWSVLAVNYALALLAGVGARMIFRNIEGRIAQAVLFLAFTLGIYHLCRQTSLATDYAYKGETRYAADVRNPYVYSHTSSNLLELQKLIHDLAAIHPEHRAMPVQIIQSENGWPLPWYLRDMTHIGYQTEVPEEIKAMVIVMDLDKTEAVQAVLNRPEKPPEVTIDPTSEPLTEPPTPKPPITYESSIFGLRPGINLNVLVRKDLWNQLLVQRALSAK